MTILTATSVAQTNDERRKAALYAGLATAVVALLMALLKGVPVVVALLGVVIGAAPIVGYDFARGALGANWRPIVAGLIGNNLFLVGFIVLAILRVSPIGDAFPVIVIVAGILSTILWPIVVGAMSPNQSLGKLLLASIIGLILGIIVLLVVALMAGQNPSNWSGIAVPAWAVWGGTVGAALSAWSK